jgi:hypothetical protein
MKNFIRSLFTQLRRWLSFKVNRRLTYLGVLILIALIEALASGARRQTFIFFAVRDRKPVVEDRLISQSGSLERRISRYVEEALLGPSSVENYPLFNRDTQVVSLLVRKDIAYVDLSVDGVFTPDPAVDLRSSVTVLRQGILRNFPFLKDAQIFIAGKEPYTKKIGSPGPEAQEKK